MKRFLSMLLCMSMIFTLFVCVPVSASTVVEYSGPQSIYYYDFEDDAEGKTPDSESLVYVGNQIDGSIYVSSSDVDNGATFTAVKDSATGTMSLQTIDTNNKSARVNTAAPITVTDADRYVVEYRVKLDSGRLISGKFNEYGVPTVYLYKNSRIQCPTTGTDIGTCTFTDWNTISTVYYKNTSGAWVMDYYLNGQKLANGTGIECTWNTGYEPAFATGEGNLLTMLNTFNAANATSNLDYIKFYASNDTFAAKLPNDTAVSLTDVEVYFNNIPTNSELTGKISVVDLNDNVVATVSDATINNNFNPGTDYAQSITLKFSEALEPGTSYKLKINGLTDFAENTLTTDLSFKTTTAVENKEYVNPHSFYYIDFEDAEVKSYFTDHATGSTDDSNLPGIYADRCSGVTEVKTESGNNYLSLATTGKSTTQFERFAIRGDANITDADKYVIEYKVRPNLNGNYGIILARPEAGYGVANATFYRGTVRPSGATEEVSASSDEYVTSYTDGEWYTVSIVYDGDYIIEGDNKYTTRDIYVNGELLKEDVKEAAIVKKAADGTYETDFIDQATVMRTTMVVYGLNAEQSQSADFDYFRYYASADTFTVNVPETTNIVAGDGIEVQFNNIPLKDDLLSKVVILDENGVEVCGIKGVTYNNNFNPGNTYAQSATLNFEEVLEKNKTYTLRLNGVSDISGNKVYHSEEFTTGSLDNFEYGSFTFAEDNKTVSIEITKNISAAKVYKLIIAGYEEYNGGIKMLSAVEKEITFDKGTKIYVSGEIDTTDCNYVKAFLWDGMKPVIKQGEKTITQ